MINQLYIMNLSPIKKLQNSFISTRHHDTLSEGEYNDLNQMIGQHILHLYELKKKMNDRNNRQEITKDLLILHDLIKIYRTPDGLQMIDDELNKKNTNIPIPIENKQLSWDMAELSKRLMPHFDHPLDTRSRIPTYIDHLMDNRTKKAEEENEDVTSDFDFDLMDIDEYNLMIDQSNERLNRTLFMGSNVLDVSRRYMMVLPDDV